MLQFRYMNEWKNRNHVSSYTVLLCTKGAMHGNANTKSTSGHISKTQFHVMSCYQHWVLYYTYAGDHIKVPKLVQKRNVRFCVTVS